MQQAYQNFNAGKYKEALNNLSVSTINIDSYEPNLAICQYLANRCQQSSLNCLRKLNDILTRKLKRNPNRMDSQTESIIKLNIAILFILQGKRDNALVILNDIYQNRDCFIEFMQSRIFLLMLELNALAKNSLEVLNLYRYYLLRPVEQRGQAQQWISIILHQHSKTFAVSRQQFTFMSRVYTNQALMQLGAPSGCLTNSEQDDKIKQELINRVKRRKNVINKYYEINVIMINRFLQAQKEMYNKNYQQCLSLMNFVNIVEEFEQMPTTKIITNILNAFATSNTGIVHFIYGKPIIALLYYSKAKSLLSKACTGVQDKDLHLFSLNYGNHIESITYNQALVLLQTKPRQSYQYFDSIRRSNQMSKNYKFWYRMAQSILQYLHDPKTTLDQRKPLLQTALSALTNCLFCIDNSPIPTCSELKNLTKYHNIPEEDLQTMIMRLKSENLHFRHSVYSLICYVSLGLQLYRKVIRIGLLALGDKKIDSRNRINILHYIIEAELAISKSTYCVKPYLNLIQQQLPQLTNITLETRYLKQGQETTETVTYQTLLYFQWFRILLSEGNFSEAWKYCELMRLKNPTSLNESIRDAIHYLHIHICFQKKFVYPYLKTS